MTQDHIENVEKTRQTLEQQTGEVRTAIEEKLKSASVQRDENIKKMLDRLREHVSTPYSLPDVLAVLFILHPFLLFLIACTFVFFSPLSR